MAKKSPITPPEENHVGQPCGKSWIDADFTCHKDTTEQSKAVGILYTLAKASKLKSETGRVRKLKELKSRIKDDKFLNTLIKELGLAHGNADPMAAAKRIAQLHSLLEKDEGEDSAPGSRKLTYTAQLVKKPKRIGDDVDFSIVNQIPEDKLTGHVASAAEIVANYAEITSKINHFHDRLLNNPITNQKDYDKAFDEVNGLFKQLSENVNTARELKNISLKTGNDLVDQEINDYVKHIGSISRENLPGYRMDQPKSLEEVAKKAESEPCP